MTNQLITIEPNVTKSLPKEYESMISIINSHALEVERANDLFHKSQSQFMDNMMTLSHLTPIRTLRQILAEVTNTHMALGEAHFKLERMRLKVRKIERKMESETDDLELLLLQNKKDQMEYGIANSLDYVEGAIRKLTNYTRQYQAIQKAFNLENFDELDFEEEEERYHISKAFQQGISAARAHRGMIDEGNQIYFEQIGINGTVAQLEMRKYLMMEEWMLSPVDENGNEKPVQEPTHQMQIDWIMSMVEKFKGCSAGLAKWKGMETIISPEALITSKE